MRHDAMKYSSWCVYVITVASSHHSESAAVWEFEGAAVWDMSHESCLTTECVARSHVSQLNVSNSIYKSRTLYISHELDILESRIMSHNCSCRKESCLTTECVELYIYKSRTLYLSHELYMEDTKFIYMSHASCLTTKCVELESRTFWMTSAVVWDTTHSVTNSIHKTRTHELYVQVMNTFESFQNDECL